MQQVKTNRKNRDTGQDCNGQELDQFTKHSTNKEQPRGKQQGGSLVTVPAGDIETAKGNLEALRKALDYYEVKYKTAMKGIQKTKAGDCSEKESARIINC